jgi:peptidoglycan hydrolase-like protein with peptidoglycan-binding domain
MRIIAAGLLLCWTLPALAQNAPASAPSVSAKAKTDAAKPKTDAAKPTTAKSTAAKSDKAKSDKAKSKSAKGEKPAAKLAAARAAYDATPLAERIAIQSDLMWTGHYNGVTDGEFKDNSIGAVKAFQKQSGSSDTGILTPQERGVLAEAARAKQETVGWRFVIDNVTGARLGLPGKYVPQTASAKSGTRWQSARGEVQVETFREPAPATIAAVHEQARKEPSRKIAYNVVRPDVFVMSGLQGLKKFYMRAQAKNNEVRGVIILYDQAMEGIMEPVVVAMSSSFIPFPATAADANAPRRKVEYATGVVVSAAGAIVTDRDAIEGCQVIVAAGLGNAERVADDKATGLALLRVYGVRDLKPLMFGDAPRGDVTIVGVADPQAQAGGGAISTVRARLNVGGVIEPALAPGFSGAAAIDPDNGFIGLALQRPQVVAGPPTAPTAMLVRTDAIRKLIATHGISPSPGRASVDFAKDSVVRVICVRK